MSAVEEPMQSVPDLRNQTLELLDNFILDHIDDFTYDELNWIIDSLEETAKSFYRKFKTIIDQDIEDMMEELDDD